MVEMLEFWPRWLSIQDRDRMDIGSWFSKTFTDYINCNFAKVGFPRGQQVKLLKNIYFLRLII